MFRRICNIKSFDFNMSHELSKICNIEWERTKTNANATKGTNLSKTKKKENNVCFLFSTHYNLQMPLILFQRKLRINLRFTNLLMKEYSF
jgi:hypothetical protein